MKGRFRKPTALKVLTGNPGHHKLPEGEVFPEREMPEVPEYLDDSAKKYWFQMLPELYRLGLVTKLDFGALAAVCSAYSSWTGAEVQIQQLRGKIAATNPPLSTEERGTAFFLMNLAIGQRKNGLKEYNTYLAHFGMSPAARPRVQGSQLQGELPFGMEAGGVNESALAKSKRLAGG